MFHGVSEACSYVAGRVRGGVAWVGAQLQSAGGRVCGAVGAFFLLRQLAQATDPPTTVKTVVSDETWLSVITDITSALSAVMVPVIGLAVGLMLIAILFSTLKKFLFKGK